MVATRTLRAEPTPPVRALNRLLAPLGPEFPDVSFEAFAKMAERTTRLDDWGDDAAVARFRRAADALRNNRHLTTWGRISLRIYLQSKFANHLLRVAFVKKHPEVREVRIEAPIVILGWYRTGTTLLHNLLSADPDHRSPRTWELCFPSQFVDDPRRDVGLRRAATAFVLNANRFVVPEQESAHHVDVDGPEECFFLLENTGVSTTLFNTYHCYEYGFSLLDEDLRDAYADHKLQLQILSLAHPKKRWVLKCPFHLWAMDALVATYPDALLVQTHRHARKALPSNCSLSAMTTSKFADGLDLVAHGRFWEDFYRAGIDRGRASRRRLGNVRIADVRTDDLSRDPVTTLRATYETLGLRFTDEHATLFREAAAQHPKDARGKHIYAPEDFGLDPARIDARFADYHEEFGLEPVRASSRPSATSGAAE